VIKTPQTDMRLPNRKWIGEERYNARIEECDFSTMGWLEKDCPNLASINNRQISNEDGIEHL